MPKISGIDGTTIKATLVEREDELRQEIKDRFLEYSLGDVGAQKRKVIERLLEIEAVINLAATIRAEAIRTTKLSAKSLSEILEISRATLYNDDVTIKYIEKRLEEYETGTNPSHEKKLKQEVNDLRELRDNTEIELIKLGNALSRIKYLEADIETKEKEISIRIDRERRLTEEVRRLQRQLLKAGESKVTPIETKRESK